MSEFKYADFTEKELNLVVTDIKKNLASAFTPLTLSIPGRRGEIFRGNDIKSKKITIEFVALHDTEEQWIEHEKALSAFFNQFLQGKDDELYPLILNNSDTVYWSYISVISDPERIADRHSSRKFSVEFICPEGLGYKPKIEKEINTAILELPVEGEAETEPVFSFIPQKDVKEIGISTEGKDFIYIGGDALTDAKNLRVANDTCNTLATWTTVSSSNVTFEMDDGIILDDAKMESTPDSLTAKTYGSYSKDDKYHGPCVKQMLSKELTDFCVKIRVLINVDDPRAKGKFELYLLDKNGTRFAKILLKDNTLSKRVGAFIQIGKKDKESRNVYSSNSDGESQYASDSSYKKKTIKYKEKAKETDKKNGIKKGQTITKTTKVSYSDEKNLFTSFYGWLELEKVGNKFTARVQELNKDGTAKGKLRVRTYTDKDNKYSGNLAGVAAYWGKLNTWEDTTSIGGANDDDFYLCHLIVDEIKTPSDSVVAREGDEITIDCANGRVYKNGEIFMNRLGIGSNFFSMAPKQTKKMIFSPTPGDLASWSVSYVPKVP